MVRLKLDVDPRVGRRRVVDPVSCVGAGAGAGDFAGDCESDDSLTGVLGGRSVAVVLRVKGVLVVGLVEACRRVEKPLELWWSDSDVGYDEPLIS